MSTNPRLTRTQTRVLKFISTHEKVPSAKTISIHMGWSSNSGALDCLDGLVNLGYVGKAHRQSGSGYDWWLTEAGKFRAREIAAI